MSIDELNAALAEKLAPICGEDAVYTTILKCQRGHIFRLYPYSRTPRPCGQRSEEGSVCTASTYAVQAPRDLTHRTVLLPLIETWRLADPRYRGYELSSACTDEEYDNGIAHDVFCPAAATVWKGEAGIIGEAIVDPTNITEALARALLTALGGNIDESAFPSS